MRPRDAGGTMTGSLTFGSGHERLPPDRRADEHQLRHLRDGRDLVGGEHVRDHRRTVRDAAHDHRRGRDGAQPGPAQSLATPPAGPFTRLDAAHRPSQALGAEHSQPFHAYVMGIPGLKICSAASADAAYGITKAMIRDNGPCFLFLPVKMMKEAKGCVTGAHMRHDGASTARLRRDGPPRSAGTPRSASARGSTRASSSTPRPRRR